MKEQSHKFTWLEFGVLLALIALVPLWVPVSHSTAQQDNRQLNRDRAQLSGTSERRVALVIGNGAYTNAPPLKNPPNDARDMAATLKELGFDVAGGINANQREMKRLIREFGQKLKAGGSGLFYYAGHGVQSKGRNYLIPVDADIQSEAEVEDSAVDVNLLLNYMDDAQNGVNIVILDACRDNPFSRSFRSASSGLAQVDAPTGTLIAYATAPGRVASDGLGQNGLYTSELLKQMRVPGLSATEMFMHVRAEVMKQTGNKQVPWEASSLVGTFYFRAPRNDAETPTTGAENETKFDPAAFELSYWETIKASTDAEDFKLYLQKYPNGQFADLAKNKIKSLEASGNSAPPKSTSSDSSPTELAFWDSIKNSTDPEDFKSYLDKYPNGQFAALARNSRRRLDAAKTTDDKSATNANSGTGNTGKTKPGAPGNAPAGSGNALPLPPDTVMRIELLTSLSTDASQRGDRFQARVIEPKDYEGATIEGQVKVVKRPGKAKSYAELQLSFDEIRLGDGRSSKMSGQVIEVIQMSSSGDVGTAGVLTERGKDLHLSQGQQLRIRASTDATVQKRR